MALMVTIAFPVKAPWVDPKARGAAGKHQDLSISITSEKINKFLNSSTKRIKL